MTRRNVKGQQITELTGQISDQAELSGVLNTLYEMHLTILLVERQDRLEE
ncbi:hypothetical protein ACFL9T_16970 [Thermodesulfobacteriota bacterium]